MVALQKHEPDRINEPALHKKIIHHLMKVVNNL